MRLEPNGWLAQIAFLAGPSWVYQGPATYVPTISHWDGEVPIYGEATDDDIAAIHEDMTEYLENAGLPEPPFRVEWNLCLPDGVSASEVRGACNRAVQDVAPADGVTAAAKVRAALADLLPTDGELGEH